MNYSQVQFFVFVKHIKQSYNSNWTWIAPSEGGTALGLLSVLRYIIYAFTPIPIVKVQTLGWHNQVPIEAIWNAGSKAQSTFLPTWIWIIYNILWTGRRKMGYFLMPYLVFSKKASWAHCRSHTKRLKCFQLSRSSIHKTIISRAQHYESKRQEKNM